MLVCSRACAYAIRALARLARHSPSKPLKTRDVASQESIPSAFLAKVLHQLVKAGLVTSSPGLTGGFRLRVPATQITLLEIVQAVDGLAQFTQCFTGLAECNEHSPCPMHDSWTKVRTSILDYLRQTTLAQVAEAWARRANDIQAVQGADALTGESLEAWADAAALRGGLVAGVGEIMETGEEFPDFQWPVD